MKSLPPDDTHLNSQPMRCLKGRISPIGACDACRGFVSVEHMATVVFGIRPHRYTSCALALDDPTLPGELAGILAGLAA